VARLGLIAGLALGGTALAAGAAQASPAPVPWNANYHNFGSTSSSYGFVFTDLLPGPVKGGPRPLGGPYVITADTCKRAVAPGHSCLVKVGYTPDGQPAADSLQMLFRTLSGQPVPVPPVQLFGGGVSFVYTQHPNGAFVFPTAAAPYSRAAGPARFRLAQSGDLAISYYTNDPVLKVDIPPDTLQWVTVVSNTCPTAFGGSAHCTVVLQAAPNTGGQRIANFQMQFEIAQTGAQVPVQDVTLVQP
jgi:hypothetical protein